MTHVRSTDPEIMDDLNCNGAVLDQTLRELEVINKLLGGNHVTIDGFEKLKLTNGVHLDVADLGCGSGDMLRRISRWARRKKLKVSLTGIDANPHVVAYANKNLAAESNIKIVCMNVLTEEFRSMQFDLITATLFFHHFRHSELVDIFRHLAQQARKGIVINDLHRHWFAFYSIRLLTKLFSKSPMVRFDAPLSVRRGFRRRELKLILQEAGIRNYLLKWRWAFRWQIIINEKGLTSA